VTIPVVNPELPEVAKLPWNLPVVIAKHHCFLAIIDSPVDAIGTETRNTFHVATLVPKDRHVAQRNVHLINPPAPNLLHWSGLSPVHVANRSLDDGVDLLVARGPSESHRLQILLPLRRVAAAQGSQPTGLTGLPPLCSTGEDPGSGTLSLRSPAGVQPEDQALGAAESLWIGARANVLADGNAFASLANAGNAPTVVGPFAQVGTVTSVGSVSLRSWARVQGDVRTAGNLLKWPGATVSGTVEQEASLLPLETVGIPMPNADPSAPPIRVLPHRTRVLDPGAFGVVKVHPRGTLVLHAGTYVFDELDLQPLAQVRMDGPAGSVVIYVASRLRQGGDFVDGTGQPADISLIYAGNEPVTLHCPFAGTVIAPNARLQLAPCQGDRYDGWFYANDLAVLPGAIVRHVRGSTLASLAACSPLTEDERAEAISLGLNPDELYGVGPDVTLHLPIPPGESWRIGLRYEVDALPENETSRFEVVQREGGRIVGGNSFVIRHPARTELAR
jgi:hypothetical protein